ncbi:N,N-dimethylformamidase beta subunit family domain-containing protein, partial [Kibdelosporangium lantanae]
GTNYVPNAGVGFMDAATDPLALAKTKAANALKIPGDALLATHVRDYRSLYDRMTVNLGQSTRNQRAMDTWSRLVVRGTPGAAADPELEASYLQFARYLMISGSRDSLPLNLQGLWVHNNTPDWMADYHTDVNVQMNYWFADRAGLGECFEPFARYCEAQVGSWTAATQQLFLDPRNRFRNSSGKVAGWAVAFSTNIYGGSGWWWHSAGNAWLCNSLWEHYEHTQDRAYLGRIHPILKGACEFWQNRLVEDPTTGKLVADHDWSPEHGPQDAKGITYAQELVWDLFEHFRAASTVLDKDRAYAQTLAGLQERLYMAVVSPKSGWYEEWMSPDNLGETTHRHLSPLIGFFPGDRIKYDSSPADIVNGVRNLLIARGMESFGWACSWRAMCWARLKDAERAYQLVMTVMRPSVGHSNGTAPNLFDMYDLGDRSIFQIDANFGAPTASAAGGPCDPPVNKIACENDSHVDQETDQWQVQAYDDSIVGYADDISYAPGNTVKFKVKTTATQYQLNIYRLGYYHGKGARLMQSIDRTGAATQPACQVDTYNATTNPNGTGMVDCGNWNTTFTWTVPTTATSGLYYAVLHREYSDGSIGESEIVFVVRDDSSHADIMFQTSDETWQAYNTFGNPTSQTDTTPKGQSLYSGEGPGNGGSSYKVSYNRPILGGNNENFIFNAEYPMLKFLESNGYDMSYTTDVDTARRGNLIQNHKVFMPVGHDEYWSNEQRSNVEAARAAGVNLAFVTGNDIFWKTRWETSPADPLHTSWRTVVCYKETKPGQVDPNQTTWTGTWRDPRMSPPKDGGKPENALLGNLFTVNGVRTDRLSVPAAYGKLRLWRNSGIQNMNPGDIKNFQPGTLGYEWNSVEDNGFQPAGVAQLSHTTVAMTDPNQGLYVLQNYGDVYGTGTKTHALTLYRYQPSGALVFGAGTVQWSWGLENDHLDANGTPTADKAMQQATVNLLADMDNV